MEVIFFGDGCSLGTPSTRQAPRVALAQQLDQLGAQRTTRLGIDGAVDGLVRDVVWAVHGLESAGDLLRGAAIAKTGSDQAPQAAATRGAQLAAQTACLLAAGGVSTLTKQSDVAIEAIDTSALELTRDGGGADTKNPGGRALTVALNEQGV